MNDAPRQHQPDPTHELQRDIHYQALETLRGMLPPPLDDTPKARARHERTALAAVAPGPGQPRGSPPRRQPRRRH